jgi:hypothetical protein
MKLTKGKLSKLRNKKNQSAKRFKKTGKSSKTKTFRKRRALNLHNTSLKKYKGGQTAKSQENDSKVVDPSKLDEVPTVPPTTDVVGEPAAPKTDVVGEPAAPKTDVVGEPPEEVFPESEVIEEPSVEIPHTTDAVNLEDGPEILPDPVSENGLEVSPGEKEELVEEGPTSENDSEDESSITEEPIAEEIEKPVELTQQQQQEQQQQSVGNDISIVAESLDKLAEYISEKIAKKLNLNLGTFNSSTDLNRDSFNAVANANEALVQS